ncbi:MAG: ABC transporter ATP-binding protein [Hespellia sp.]|nr:ABC transporter ATP-binding protein [Hespellia sp.]
MIEVKNLVKKYGNHLAVDHLSFQIEKGQIYGFLGPNGAGKSTTMNIMTGYLGATEGQVMINGHDILKEPEEAKKCIGYLPELPPLYTDMKVEEYLQFVAELKKIDKKKREEEMEQVMKLAKLMDVRGRLIRNLSKGYRQRVGLAQAMIGFPEIIILDEPTVGLDPKQIIEIRELIRTLAKDHTVILSSHILAEVREVCDYIMIIAKGKLVASDTPQNLEHLMEGSEEIELTAKTTPENVHSILKKVNHLGEVELKETEEGTYAKVEVLDDADVKDDIFFAFAEAKCVLSSLQTKQVSLEDVFLELTGEEQSLEETTRNDRELIEESDRANRAADESAEEDESVEVDLEREEQRTTDECASEPGETEQVQIKQVSEEEKEDGSDL